MLANNKIFRLLLILICVFAISVRIYWASQQNELDQDEYYTVLAANNKTNILGNNFKDFISDFSNISGKELYKIIFFGDKSVKDCLDDIVALYKNSKDPYISNLYYSLFRLSFIGREVIDKKNIIITGTALNCLLFIISFIFIYKLLKYVFEDNREIILGSIFCISLMPSSITFAMFLRAYQIQETFFIIITYIVLSTISENKYSIKNFILTTIIAGICYITQFSSLLFVLILSAILFYNFLISNKEKFHLNNLLNFSISNKIKNIFEELAKKIKNEYKAEDSEMKIKICKCKNVKECISKRISDNIIDFMNLAPDGVLYMDRDIKGLVQTSANNGVLKEENGKLTFTILIRSSIESSLNEIASIVEIASKRTNAKFKRVNEYPAWEFDSNSKIKDKAVKIYKKITGKNAKIKSIHAGLECGILKKVLPKVDMISIGPDIKDVHTPNEHLSISSVERTWKFLKELIINLE